MKTLKKISTMILTFVLIIGMLPIYVFEAFAIPNIFNKDVQRITVTKGQSATISFPDYKKCWGDLAFYASTEDTVFFYKSFDPLLLYEDCYDDIYYYGAGFMHGTYKINEPEFETDRYYQWMTDSSYYLE